MPKKVGLPDFVKFKHDDHFVDEISSRTRTEIIRNIPVDKMMANTLQPRKDMGDLKDLSDSIKEKGILEPILVRPKNGQFEIIAGERRYRAAKAAGLKEVPCIEYNIPDNEAMEIAIVENIQRKDLNIFEQAFSLKSLSEIYGYVHQEIARKIGKSRVTVSELLRITDLPTDVVQRCLDMGINSKTFILELVKLKNKKEMMEVLDNFSDRPFSRDILKIHRKTKELDKKTQKGIDQIKPFKFKFSSEDKSVNIKFDINRPGMNRDKLITILENLIENIRHKKIKDLKFRQ